MIECGSQCWLCDLPVRFDNYKGCTHGCKYCFVQRGNDDAFKVGKSGTIAPLKKFIEGERNKEVNWVDWDIPIHWGGMSDPFQPYEEIVGTSYEALKLFAETGYPFVVSTKGRLVADERYLDLIEKCNCVVQISMVCSEYDKMELGAPPFKERVEMAKKVAERGIRVNARIQPYMTQVLDSVLKESLPMFAEAGVYGVTIEGMKFQKKIRGLEKVGADFCYPVALLKGHFSKIKAKTHELGMSFYCGENRLRAMGDSLTCCGIDGLEGFKPNTYNLNHILNGDKVEPTEAMKKDGSADCFKALEQTNIGSKKYNLMSFAEGMTQLYGNKKPYIDSVLGIKK